MSVSLLEYMGGAQAFSFSTDRPLDWRFRLWRVTATNGGRTLYWPPVTNVGFVYGGPIFIVCNVGTNSFTVRDTELQDAGIVVTAGKALIVSTYKLGAIQRWAPETPRTYSSY